MNILTGVTVVQGLGSAVGLIGVVISMRRANRVNRLDTLQRMIAELNQLRQSRADSPQLERELFPSRKLWTDERIQEHMAIVQLANTLEWAYLARRDGLIEADVWKSWISTWQTVISANADGTHLYDPSVWTFGREGTIATDLKLITEEGFIVDPYKSPLDKISQFILSPRGKSRGGGAHA